MKGGDDINGLSIALVLTFVVLGAIALAAMALLVYLLGTVVFALFAVLA